MTSRLVFSQVNEPELCRIAELVALFVRPGEMIALSGELGAGKTAFARAFVRAILDDADVEVPSPTFNLLQLYESPRFPIAHLDLYRLSNPSEVGEVIADDVLAGSVAVVEWPERVASLLPPSRLDVRISETGAADFANTRAGWARCVGFRGLTASTKSGGFSWMSSGERDGAEPASDICKATPPRALTHVFLWMTRPTSS